MKFQSSDLNIASLFALLLYVIFEILPQAVFIVGFIIGQEMFSCLELIRFNQEPTYGGIKHIILPTYNKVPPAYAWGGWG